MKKPTHYLDALNILRELKLSHPTTTLGQILSSIVYEYNDVWGLSDREFLFALEKYKASLELDFEHSSSDIEDIVKQGMDLKNILNEEEEDL